MERSEALRQVVLELGHIPLWPGEFQGLLRSIYRMLRVNSLGTKKPGSAGAVLHRCIAILWRDVPSAEVSYDRTFFDG
ncbi:hypothetical protein [Frigoriglobus tundricola]|uniref:Uncharacterized protein n=1 Tax=Frigoriglobus tundricola TaxID=2774151 RepID=A0A6M5YNK2_9BACT|nr:hypothetical protein [Frigoriglobus tundricola]QJW95114.1 hypothetical protein FTUN_2653 [Frigoriglobus tundricola]